MKKSISDYIVIKKLIHEWLPIRALMMAFMTLGLTACVAAVLLAVGGSSFSSSIAAVAVLAFPTIGGDRFTQLIPIGPTPQAMVIEPNGQNLFIAENSSRSIARIDTSSYEISSRVSLDEWLDPLRFQDLVGSPISLAFNPIGDRLYVTTRVNYPKSSAVIIDEKPKGLVIFNPNTMEVESRIDTMGSPAILTFTPDGRKFYVANTEANVAVFNTASLEVSSVISVDNTPLAMAYSSIGTRLLVANTGNLRGDPTKEIPPNPGNTVSVIDTQRDILISSLTVGEGPSKILIKGIKAYVLNEVSESVSVIDLTHLNVIKEIPVGSSPKGAILIEKTGKLYISSFDDQKITVIDTEWDEINSLILLEDKSPTALAATRDGERLFALVPHENQVIAFDLTTDVPEPTYIEVGDEPVAITIQDSNNQGFALAEISNDITVFDTAKGSIKAIAALELQPFSIAFDSLRNFVYISNAVHNTISVMDQNFHAFENPIRVGPQPIEMIIDKTSQFGYSLNFGDCTISKIDLNARQQVQVFRNPGGLTLLKSIAVSESGSVLYVLGCSEEDCSLIAVDTKAGDALAKWKLFNNAVSDLAWDSLNKYLYILGTYKQAPFKTINTVDTDESSELTTLVSRLDESSGILSDLFIISDVDSVSLAITGDQIIVIGDVTNRQIYQINANNISDFKIINTGASDFVNLSQSGNHLFVSDAGVDYPYIDNLGLVVGASLSTGKVIFTNKFDNRASGLALHSSGHLLYAALTSQDMIAIMDASSGEIKHLISLPRVQYFN